MCSGMPVLVIKLTQEPEITPYARDVIDRVRRYLRRVDQDISGLDEGSVGEIVALVVVHDRTEVV